MGDVSYIPTGQARADRANTTKAHMKAARPSMGSRQLPVTRMTLDVLELEIRKHTVGQLEEQIVQHNRVEDRLHALSSFVLKARDDESRRIARELHDSAGQYLVALHMNLAALQRDPARLNLSQVKWIADSIEIVEKCTAEIRTISYLLHPPLLDEMGLASALACYVDGFSARSGIRTELDIAKDFPRIHPDMETAMFRIVQQGLSNIHRHSGSSVAKIKIWQDSEHVGMTISDEGRGMAPQAVREINSGTGLVGVGIAGMRERTRVMKGYFHIQSCRDGTTISITLPPAENT